MSSVRPSAPFQQAAPGSPRAASPAHGLVSAAARHARGIVVTALLTSAALVGLTLLKHRTYTSASSIMPQNSSGGDLARLSGLAAQFGVSPGLGGSGQSPEFYAELVTSAEILRQVVDTTFVVDGRPTHLQDVFDVPGSTRAEREDAAVQRLGQLVVAAPSTKTGVVRITVTAPSPELARDILRVLLSTLNTFNLETRQSRAKAERKFTEARIASVKSELQAREYALQSFLQQNRVYSSPELALQRERLQAEVDARRSVVSTLMTSYEQSRIEEVRDTPVFTVVESPRAPTRPDTRRVPVKAIAGAMLGALFALLVSYGLDVRSRLRLSDAPEDAELRDMLGGLPLVGRWLA